jgi:spermidine/putrescine transport system ATP-binding protein
MTEDAVPPILRLRAITKKFGNFTAVDQIDLDIEDGEFFTIVGPSGSGKTTLIRLLVGMDKPTSGEIRLHDKIINDVPANKRPTCMVFQSLALFPHRSVGENIEFPLKIAGVSKQKRRQRSLELMEQLRLPRDYHGKAVQQCSGGERQRIALARALAFDPQILFFDEPLSALDFRLRKTLEKELKDIHRETGKTFVYITHSLEEAMVMSDRIGIMRAGGMVQVGDVSEIYNRPRNKFVAQFMGEVNTLEVERADDQSVRNIKDGKCYRTPEKLGNFSKGFLIVRPEVMRLGPAAENLENKLDAIYFNDYPLGSRIQYQVRSADDGQHWLIEKLQDEPYEGRYDERVVIGWRPEDSIIVSE